MGMIMMIVRSISMALSLVDNKRLIHFDLPVTRLLFYVGAAHQVQWCPLATEKAAFCLRLSLSLQISIQFTRILALFSLCAEQD